MITTKAEISIHRLKSGFVAIHGDDMRAYSTGHDLLEGLREILDVPTVGGDAQPGVVPVRNFLDGVETSVHRPKIRYVDLGYGIGVDVPVYPIDSDTTTKNPAKTNSEMLAESVEATAEAAADHIASVNSEIQKAERDGPIELANLVKLEGGDDAWVRLPFNVLETALGTTAPTVTKWIDEARDRNLIRVYRVYRGEGIGNWFSIHPNHGGTAPEYEAWAGIELKDEPEKKPVEPLKAVASEKPSAPANPTEMTPDALLVMDELRNRVSMFGKSSFKMKLSALSDLTEVKLRDIPGILELLQARGMIGFSPASGGTYAFTIKEKEAA